MRKALRGDANSACWL